MNRSGVFKVLRILAATLCAASALTVARAQQVDAALPLAVGEKWTWSYHNMGDKRAPFNFFNEVQRVDANNAWLYGESEDPNTRMPKFWWRHDQKRGTRLEMFAHDANAAQNIGPREMSNEKSDDSVQFPLTVGKNYTVKEFWPSGRGFTDWKAEVQAVEKIKTPAGEFEAFRIVYKGFWTNTAAGGTGRAQMTRWWSPNVKNLVRSEYEDWVNGRPWGKNSSELVKWEPRAADKPAGAASAAK